MQNWFADLRVISRWITLSEVRLGLRLIAKQPILSITVVLALATGIGLATIGFTLREALLHGQLPFANGDRFVRLVLHSEAEDNVEVDLDTYHAIRDTSKSFAHLGAVGDGEYALEGEDGTVEAIRVGLVTPRSFQFLPAVPMIGRVLTPEDGAPGAEPVVLVRESLWLRRYGASPSIVGQPIQLSGLKRTVVGILPDTFKFPSAGEMWVPLDEATLAGRAGPSGASLTVFGILRDGLEKDGATAELSAYARPARQGKPGTATSVLALPFTGDDDIINTVMAGLVAVLVLVLLVAASNIASLVSARTWSRSSELAVRTALGASRSRVVGQLFVEVAVLSAIASVIGLVFAQVALSYMVGMIGDIPFWMTFDPTIRTMAFVVALALLVSVVSGLGPALKVTSVNLNGALHAHGRGSAAGGFGSVGRVLVVEVALSVALLNCALVTTRALASYIDDIPALPKGQVLTARLSGEESKEIRDRLLAAIRAIPGVLSAGAASHLPRLDPVAMPMVIEPLNGQSQPLTGSAPATEVSDGFLESIGGRTMTGRSFTANDFLAGAAPVAIVNQPFVDRFFNGGSPVGRRVKVLTPEWREIIGVVPDLGVSAADRGRAAGVYVPLKGRGGGRSQGRPARHPAARRRRLGAACVSFGHGLGDDGARRDGAVAVGRLDLRAALVHGHAPHARDRYSRGARSAKIASARHCCWQRIRVGWRRHRAWDHCRCDARGLPVRDADSDARRWSDDAHNRDRRAGAGQPCRRVVPDAAGTRHSTIRSARQRVGFRNAGSVALGLKVAHFSQQAIPAAA